ncbi:MAG: hypothetical protein JRC68_10390 [Deltaproteobacteria bacterium]|nr:hypothetical protein [Deltaproteobacteria bacterium]
MINIETREERIRADGLKPLKHRHNRHTVTHPSTIHPKQAKGGEKQVPAKKTKTDRAFNEFIESGAKFVLNEYNEVKIALPDQVQPIPIRHGGLREWLNTRLYLNQGFMIEGKTWTALYKRLDRLAEAHSQKHVDKYYETRKQWVRLLTTKIQARLDAQKVTLMGLSGYKITTEFCKEQDIDPKPFIKWIRSQGGVSDRYILGRFSESQEELR